MLWLVLCALIVLSPVILFLLLDIARNRYPSTGKVTSVLQPHRRAPAIARRPDKADGREKPPQLRASSAALEAQFLLAPQLAIREAEENLLLSGNSRRSRAVAESGDSSRALRLAFEDLIREVELAEESRLSAKNSRRVDIS